MGAWSGGSRVKGASEPFVIPSISYFSGEETEAQKVQSWGTWLAQLGEHVTLDLGVAPHWA